MRNKALEKSDKVRLFMRPSFALAGHALHGHRHVLFLHLVMAGIRGEGIPYKDRETREGCVVKFPF